MTRITAAEARRKSEEVAATGAQEELRDQIYRNISDQASIGAKATAFPRLSKFSDLTYQAVVADLRADGYTVTEVMDGLLQISW